MGRAVCWLGMLIKKKKVVIVREEDGTGREVQRRDHVASERD